MLLSGPNPEEEKQGKLNQKGSDVDDKRLRFDFAWDDALTAEQIAAVEEIVNQQIQSNLKVLLLGPL